MPEAQRPVEVVVDRPPTVGGAGAPRGLREREPARPERDTVLVAHRPRRLQGGRDPRGGARDPVQGLELLLDGHDVAVEGRAPETGSARGARSPARPAWATGGGGADPTAHRRPPARPGVSPAASGDPRSRGSQRRESHVTRPSLARTSTSCTFIARSTAETGAPAGSLIGPPFSANTSRVRHVLPTRTRHVLREADTSHATNKRHKFI